MTVDPGRTSPWSLSARWPQAASRTASMVAGATWLLGILTVASALLPPDRARLRLLTELLPYQAADAAAAVAAALGVLLLYLAGGLRRRKHRAWVAAVVVTAVVGLSHIVKGLDVEEATASAVVFALLLGCRGQFQAEADPGGRKLAVRRFVQLVLLGTGDPDAERFFAWADAHHGDRFRAWLRFDNGRAHRIEAGADFFLMPSRFEPCGLNQMYSLRYGTLPIVRATGGLVDTVANYDEATGEGTGFMFGDLHPDSLANTIGWAVSTWYDRPDHIKAMRHRAMLQDFSWARAARDYRDLYLRAYERRRGHGFAG